MTVTQIWSETGSTGGEEDRTRLFYDDAARTVLIQCDNGTDGVRADGHALLTLYDNTVKPAIPIAAVNTDQFNDGGQHILTGPGATGVDINGSALPTRPITSAQVAQVEPQRSGGTLTAYVDMTWGG